MAQHPSLIFTAEEVKQIREEYQNVPLFRAEVEKASTRVLTAIETGIDVPVPKDMAGGYTHEQHKQNWIHMQLAGILYQITEEDRYAAYVREMLLTYAELYPTLGLHPTQQSYSTGKIFWQCLNDANWLVYTSQAYDCIYDFLSKDERKLLETTLFRPMAHFLSVENPQFFNRIHNHSTWACAAVGMIGLVMEDEILMERALYGLPDSLAPSSSEDNDGGLIQGKGSGQKGFLAQLDRAFSPDGFFTEGPYYLRYALSPYLLFATGLENSAEGIDVFAYRDTLLKKAIYSLLNQTDARGWVLPINDAQKGMSWYAPSIVSAVDIAYLHYGQDPDLLHIAQQQQQVTLDLAGLQVARDLALGKDVPWQRESVFYTDGSDGSQGGLSVLRGGSAPTYQLTLALKYSAHGGGHGHFDRLSYSLYNVRGEVIQDYGAARWVNIEQKGGGRYLPENQTWGKQTVAHNTVVVDQHSQNQGQVRLADEHAPFQQFVVQSESGWQAVSVADTLSYPGCKQSRTMIMVQDSLWEYPMIVDLFRISSEDTHSYDLPFWYQGHFLDATGVKQIANEGRIILGSSDGYQHLWQESQAVSSDPTLQFSWFDGQTFTSVTTLTQPGQDSLMWVRIGAHDPNFNLRQDPGVLIRKEGTHTFFFSVIEHHGGYDPAIEIPLDPYSRIKELRLLRDDATYTVAEIREKTGRAHLILMANQDLSQQAAHSLMIEGNRYEWIGPITVN